MEAQAGPACDQASLERLEMITLDWPPRQLSPNARVHYSVKSPITKGYLAHASNTTRVACHDHGLRDRIDPHSDDPITLAIEFHPPDARRRDLDNMLSSIKAGLDGIAEALGVNDQRFALRLTRGQPVKGGRVVVTLS